jgi:hypothetical protein
MRNHRFITSTLIITGLIFSRIDPCLGQSPDLIDASGQQSSPPAPQAKPAAVAVKPPIFSGLYDFQCFLLKPIEVDLKAPVGAPVTATKWAVGTLNVQQTGNSFTGTLEAKKHKVQLSIKYGEITPPPDPKDTTRIANFSAHLEGELPLRYALYGWALYSKDNHVVCVSGAIAAVGGLKGNEAVELTHQPVGTIGYFTIMPMEKPWP